MPLVDAFSPDVFSTYSLTDAIQKLPPAPTIIAELGLFRDIPVATTTVMIEERQGVLTLVPTSSRGGPGTQMAPEKRVATPLKVPHVQVEDLVTADDVLNVRAFGSENAQQGIQDVVNTKMVPMRRSIDVTNEYLRLGALSGTVTYPSGSVDSNIDLFATFGTTEQEVDFVLDTTTTEVIEEKCAAVRDAIQSALGGTPYTGIVALCSRTFFRDLIAHDRVRDNYLQMQQRLLGAQLGQVSQFSQNRQMVDLGGIRFIEYYGSVSGTSFTSDNVARAFPIGADIFHSYYAPADIVEAAGTLGQPLYMRQYMSQDGKRVHLEAQSNPLNICTRPRALVKLNRDT